MTNHDQYPAQGSQKDIPEDHPYQPFALEDARPSNLLVHRNVRDSEGNIIPNVTKPERGWVAMGTTVHNGVEYTRVGKPGEADAEGNVPQKNIPTETLKQWQEAERVARQTEELGEEAVSAAASETPNWEGHGQSEPVGHIVDPMVDAITPAMLKELREQVAASNVAESVAPVQAVTGLESAPKSLEDQLQELSKGLSAEDIQHLDSFASYTQEKALAQKRGHGEDSTRYGQYLGQEYLEMSPAAQKVADRYARVWMKLNPYS